MILSGPAGCGKTTLCRRLVETFEEAEQVVTCTTRAPRSGEVDGEDYHFFSDERFDQGIKEGEFLEWARVHSARYGTLRKAVFDKLNASRSVVLNIDVQGAAAIRGAAQQDEALRSKLVTVFVLPPSLSVLRERMLDRGADRIDSIEKRIEAAEREIAQWVEYDFCVLSGTKEQDFRQVESIWLAETRRVFRLRAAGMDVPIK